MAIKTLKSWANISLHSGGADCQLFSPALEHTHCHRTMAITILVLYNFSRAATQHPLRELAALYFVSFYYVVAIIIIFYSVAFLLRRTRKVFWTEWGSSEDTPYKKFFSPTRMRTCGNYSGLSKIDGVLSCEWGAAQRRAGAWQVDMWVQIIGTLRACNQC